MRGGLRGPEGAAWLSRWAREIHLLVREGDQDSTDWLSAQPVAAAPVWLTVWEISTVVEPADSETWWLKKKLGQHEARRREKLLWYGLSGLGDVPTVLQFIHYKVRFPNCNGLHKRTDMNMPAPLLLRKLRSMELGWKSLMSDHGSRVWISMRCGFPTRRNVFIILCNDSLDNNSLSSEGISIKMEKSIKMPYARIYKLGNFLDYCNHLQHWLFQCGIDRF